MQSNKSMGLTDITTSPLRLSKEKGSGDEVMNDLTLPSPCAGEGKCVFIHVFGCRSSLCEGEYIAGALSSRGALITEDLNTEINAAVIVTCSVTHEADRKCRQLVRRVRRALGDSGVLAVCGCWSQSLDTDTAHELGIDILAGTRGKRELPDALMSMLATGRSFIDMRTPNIFAPSEWEELSIDSPVMHSRAFVKIQDGCNHFCTYCIIPFLRGRPVSRPTESVTSEVRRLIENGCREVVFTGIHLGIYGQDSDSSLASLIREVSSIDGLSRLRLGSLEPFCLSDELLDALGECSAFCPHLHLPLQSGDDDTLSRMRRGYTARDFIDVCERARRALGSDLHISSDILVGFPGESDQAFTNTLDVMRASGLGRVHVFPYSPRKGTLAASMPGQIPHAEKISRTSRAIALGHELYTDYMSRFVGRDVELLIETNGRGHTRHYIEASCEGRDNEIINAHVTEVNDGRLECVRRD